MHFCSDITALSWLPYSTYLHLFFFMLSRRWQPLQVCSKMFERLFRAGMSDLNQFFCKISMFDIWRLNLCDRFLPGCSHLTAGRLFLQTMFILIWGFCSFQELLISGIARFRKLLVSGITHFRFLLISGFSLKRANCSNRESCCKDDCAPSCYNIKCWIRTLSTERNI